MSIPWRGFPNQYVVQVVVVCATIVSPIVLAYLTKKIYFVARGIRDRTKLGLRASEDSDDKTLCDTFTEQEVCAGDPNANEDGTGGGATCEGTRVHEDVSQEDVTLNQKESDPHDQYCVCGSSADSLPGTPLHQGECGDCRKKIHMESPYSEECIRTEAHLNTEQADHLGNSFEVPKSRGTRACSPRREEANNRRDRTSGPDVLGSETNPTEQVGRLKDRPNQPQDSTTVQTLSKSEEAPVADTEYASCPTVTAAKTPGDPAVSLEEPGSERCDVDPASCSGGPTTKTGAVSGSDNTTSVNTPHNPRDSAKSPRNRSRSPRNRTNIEKVLDTSKGIKSETQEGHGQDEVKVEVDTSGPEKGAENTNDSTGRGTVASSSIPSPDKREREEDHRETDSADENVLYEGSTEPHKVLSWSSSDSFSTANCSSASSATNLRNATSRPRHQTAPKSGSGSADRQPRRAERHRDRRARSKHRRRYRENSTSPPIFEFVTPPQLFPLPQSRHTKRPREAMAHATESDDNDDISGLHGGSQVDRVDETVDISEWLSTTLKSWLPDFSSKREEQREESEQRPERRENDGHFERFDVRNVLGTDHQSAQDPFASGPKVCPHSCVSSLCNFRRTLESWKKQLLAMHAALDASSAAISQRHCVYCDEDYHSHGPHQDCYTMHVAQEFWRTVLQFKRSHLESNDCPHISQQNSGRVTENDTGEQDEQCSLGHRHSCSSDYSGCSQHQNSPVSEDVHEAPCVHVLLDDVDLLLQKLEGLKQSSSPRKSSVDQTDSLSNTKISEKSENYQGRPSLSCCHKSYLSNSPSANAQPNTRIQTNEKRPGDQSTLDEQGRSTASIISPSPSISLEEELPDLGDMTEDENCTDDENSGRFLEHEPARKESFHKVAKTCSATKTPVINQDVSMPEANSRQVSSHSKMCELSNRLMSLAEKLGDHGETDSSSMSESERSTGDQSNKKSEINEHTALECPKNGSEASPAAKTSLVKQRVQVPQARSLDVPLDPKLQELPSCPMCLAEKTGDLEEGTGPEFNGKKVCAYHKSREKPTKLDNTPIESPNDSAEQISPTKSRVNAEVPRPRTRSHDDDELCARDKSSQKPKKLENALAACPRFDSEASLATSTLKNRNLQKLSRESSEGSSDSGKFHLQNRSKFSESDLASSKESSDSVLYERERRAADEQNGESLGELKDAPAKSQHGANSKREPPPNSQETTTPRAKSPHILSDSRLLQLLALSEQNAHAGEQRSVSKSEELAISKSRSLGKFALRYLDHIEQKLEANDLISLGPEVASPKPTHGGDPPKPMPRAILKDDPTTSHHGEIPTPRKRQTDTAATQKLSAANKTELNLWQQSPPGHVPAPSSDVSSANGARFGHEAHEESQQVNSDANQQDPSGNSLADQNEPSVITAFHDIISELNKLQSVQSAARESQQESSDDQDEKSPRSVKFDPRFLSVRRSQSYTNSSPRHLNSPPLLPAVLSSSSCLSLTNSVEDIGDRDLTVTQAFDQLDKVVDDLLKLISIQNVG